MEPWAISSLDFKIESSWANLIVCFLSFFLFLTGVGTAWLIKEREKMKMWHNLILVKTLNTVSNKVLVAKWIQIRLDLDSSILYWLKAEGWWQKLRIKAICRLTEMSGSPAPGINEALVLVNSFINDLHDEAKEYLNECYWGNCGAMLWIPVSSERSAKKKINMQSSQEEIL